MVWVTVLDASRALPPVIFPSSFLVRSEVFVASKVHHVVISADPVNRIARRLERNTENCAGGGSDITEISKVSITGFLSIATYAYGLLSTMLLGSKELVLYAGRLVLLSCKL
jgi:hypothetical protein